MLAAGAIGPSHAAFRAPRGDSRLRRVAHNPPVCGRNEPCPCKSGKKYKKCCIGQKVQLPPTEEPVLVDGLARAEAAKLVEKPLVEHFPMEEMLVPDAVRATTIKPEAKLMPHQQEMVKSLEFVKNYGSIRAAGEPIGQPYVRSREDHDKFVEVYNEIGKTVVTGAQRK